MTMGIGNIISTAMSTASTSFTRATDILIGAAIEKSIATRSTGLCVYRNPSLVKSKSIALVCMCGKVDRDVCVLRNPLLCAWRCPSLVLWFGNESKHPNRPYCHWIGYLSDFLYSHDSLYPLCSMTTFTWLGGPAVMNGPTWNVPGGSDIVGFALSMTLPNVAMYPAELIWLIERRVEYRCIWGIDMVALWGFDRDNWYYGCCVDFSEFDE
ncbi:hypothetical protein BDD12DRAFT_810899 [Trichophaea hybrida]|nr:hypothetical protein BDD12DRAFT_810899 [Trichophaea hybrida]